MNAWWQELAARERLTLSLGALVLALVVGYLAVLEPALDRRQALAEQARVLEAELDWLKSQVSAVRATSTPRPALADSRPASQGSLLAVVDASARAAGLGDALRRVRPQGAAVLAELDRAAYDELMRWLATMETTHGLRTVTLTVDRSDTPGSVNAQVRIEPAPGRSPGA
jgi:general secretion pathway protein M